MNKMSWEGGPEAHRTVENKGTNWLGSVGSIVGAFAGVMASRVFGLMLMIPVGIGLVLLALLMKFGPRDARPLAPGVSLMWGHSAWVLIGLIYMGRPDFLIYAEVAFYAIAGVFLLRRPSLAWVSIVTLAEGASLLLNVWQITTAYDRAMRLALFLHVGLRVLVGLALILGWRRFRQASLEVEPPAQEVAPSFAEDAPAAPVSVSPGSWLRCAQCGLGHRARVEGSCPKCGTLYGQGSTVAPVNPKAASRRSTTPQLMVVIVSAVTALTVVGFGARSGLFSKKDDAPEPSATLTPRPAPQQRRLTGKVRLVGEDAPGAIQLWVDNHPTAVGSSGQFEMRNPPVGTLRVRVVSAHTVEGEISREVVVTEEAETVVPDIEMTPAGTVRGRVTFDQGSARTGDVTVEIEGLGIREAVDEQGNFELEKLPAGEQTVRVTSPNHQPVSRTVAVRWQRVTTVELPPLQPRVNANGCAPTARWVGPTSRDMVGPSDAVREDGKRDWLFYLEPCRKGLIRRILLTERGADSGWDTSPGNIHALLGVAHSRAPGTLLNQTGSGEVSVEVYPGQRLLLYIGREPASERVFKILLEYADGSSDLAEAGSTP